MPRAGHDALQPCCICSKVTGPSEWQQGVLALGAGHNPLLAQKRLQCRAQLATGVARPDQAHVGLAPLRCRWRRCNCRVWRPQQLDVASETLHSTCSACACIPTAAWACLGKIGEIYQRKPPALLETLDCLPNSCF